MPSTTARSQRPGVFSLFIRLTLLLVILLSTSAAASNRPSQYVMPVPYNVNATTGLAGKITISWDSVSHFLLDHFEIWRDVGGGILAYVADVPYYSAGSYDYDLILDDYNYYAYQDYTFVVLSCPPNGYACGDASDSATGSGVIASPHLFASSGTYSDRVEISFQEWIDGSNRYYEIYRSDTSGGTYTKIGEIMSASWSSDENLFVDSAVVQGTTYYYKGKICNDIANRNPSRCSELSLTPAQGNAGIPGDISVQASDGTSHQIEISWVDAITWGVGDSTLYYQLYRTPTNTPPTDLNAPLQDQLNNPYATDVGMTPYKDYYYWVRALSSNGNYSDLSAADSGWRTYALAQNISASDGTSTDAVDVSWTNPDDSLIDFYLIYRADSAAGTRSAIGSSTILGFNDTSANPGDTYYYWISACDLTMRCSGMAGPDDGWRALGNPPTITDIADQTINEDSSTGALAFTVDDDETNPGMLQVSGSSSNTTLLPDANIVIAGTTGNRTVTLTPAADQNGTATVTLTVTDPTSQTDSTSFDLIVTPVNDPPTDITLSNASVDENQPSGTAVGTFTTTDPDSGDTHAYSLVSGTGDSGNASFTISGDVLYTDQVFDYETTAQYSIRVETDDLNGETYQEAFTISVQDLDEIPPAVSSIVRADPSPTNASSVGFTVTFDESVSGVDPGDFSLTVGGGITGASVSSVSANSGSSITVAVNTGSGSGTLRLDLVDDDSIQDAAGNPLGGTGVGNGDYTGDESYTLDRTNPAVSSITRAGADPTNASSVDFDVAFTKDVSGVDTADFSLTVSGLSGVSITSVASSSPADYTVTVDTGSGSGTLRLDLSDDDSISDAVGNPLGGNGAGNGDFTSGESYTIDRQAPLLASSTPADLDVVSPGPTEIIVNFSEDVLHDGSGDAADNTANYLLFRAGANGVYDTSSCAVYPGGSADDVFFSINSAVYDNNSGNGPYQVVLGINGGTALPAAEYRLLVCGTTSIQDLAGNTINAGSDAVVTFIVRKASLPNTGFAPGKVTRLPRLPLDDLYSDVDGMRLEIPSLGLSQQIVGVPVSENGWDLTWLDSSIGWLNGSAFPTWEGNTALTAHAYLASGLPGPFAELDQLRWGQQIIIRSATQRYVYQVRSLDYVKPYESWPIATHEDYDWITLITCRSYDESLGAYQWRTVVRAVLVNILPE